MRFCFSVLANNSNWIYGYKQIHYHRDGKKVDNGQWFDQIPLRQRTWFIFVVVVSRCFSSAMLAISSWTVRILFFVKRWSLIYFKRVRWYCLVEQWIAIVLNSFSFSFCCIVIRLVRKLTRERFSNIHENNLGVKALKETLAFH